MDHLCSLTVIRDAPGLDSYGDFDDLRGPRLKPGIDPPREHARTPAPFENGIQRKRERQMSKTRMNSNGKPRLTARLGMVFVVLASFGGR